MNKKTTDVFKENIDNLWRDVFSYSQCLIIAYDRLSQEGNNIQLEMVECLDMAEIEELRYLVSIYHDKSYDSALLDRKMRFILNRFDNTLITMIINNYKGSFMSTNSMSDNFF